MKILTVRHMIVVCFVFLFAMCGQKVCAAQHVAQTIVVLPFKAKNAQENTSGMALGVQQIFEDILLLHPKLQGKNTQNLINTIFFPNDSFDAWLNGTDNGALQRAIISKKYDIIICGELDGNNNQVTLTIINTTSNQKKTLTVQIKNAIKANAIGNDFLTALDDAGFPFAENHKKEIHYNETISKQGISELGMLYKKIYISSIKANDNFSIKEYERFSAKEKNSYLAMTLLGHAYEKADMQEKAKSVMNKALAINKSGYDALKYLEFYGYLKSNIRQGVHYGAKLFKARNMENDYELYSGLTNYYAEIQEAFDEKYSNAILKKICDYLIKEVGENEAITIYFYTLKINKLRQKAHDLYANNDKAGALKLLENVTTSLEFLKQTDSKEINTYIGSCIAEMLDLAAACTQENKYQDGVKFYGLATKTLNKFANVDARQLLMNMKNYATALISIGKSLQAQATFDEYISTLSERGHFDSFSLLMPYIIKANISYAVQKNKAAYEDCVYAFKQQVDLSDIGSTENIDIFFKIMEISTSLAKRHSESEDSVSAKNIHDEVNKFYTMIKGYLSPTQNLSALVHLSTLSKYINLDDKTAEYLQQAFQYFENAANNDHKFPDSFSSEQGKDDFLIAAINFSAMLNNNDLQDMNWKVIDKLIVFINTYTKGDQNKQNIIQHLYATNFVKLTASMQEIPKEYIEKLFDQITKYKDIQLGTTTLISIYYNELGKPALANQLYDSLIEQSRASPDHDSKITLAILLNASHSLYKIEKYSVSLQYINTFLANNGEAILDENNKLELAQHIASIHCALGNYNKALDILHHHIIAFNKLYGENSLEAAKLVQNVSVILVKLGDFQQAIVLDKHVLEVFRRELGEQNELTISAYINYGYLQMVFFDYENAELNIRKALDISQKMHNQDSLDYARGLQALSLCRARKNDFKQALEIEQKAEKIYKELLPENHTERLLSQQNIAVYLTCLKQNQEALPILQNISFFALQSDDLETETTIMANMAKLMQQLGDIEAAIFLGKICVNNIQHLRKINENIEAHLQSTLMLSNRNIFDNLINALTQQGRLLEAQIIISMIKEDELFDFMVRSSQTDSTSKIDFIGPERELYTNFMDLIKKIKSTAERSETSTAMTSTLRQELLHTYNTLQASLASLSPQNGDAALKAQLGLQDHLKPVLAMMTPGTVLLHTIMAEDTLWILATTPGSEMPVARKVAISYKDLSVKIRDFREMLVDRAKDPRPLAKELYAALIAPVQDILDEEQVHTLLLSLDGPMRYLPPAALHDGTQWLAQKYAVSIFTEAARESLRAQPTGSTAQWHVAGLGVTKGHGTFSPLPGVAEELAAIVQSPENPHASLQGEYVLDEDFTAARMQQLLHKKYPVVHVATHFEFHPGTVHTSYVLTGDGQQLTLAQLKGEDFPFAGVEQLTLSACNTAMTAASSGSEVEGFGALAQRKGAQSVLATLWPVADASTGALMARYYKEKGTDSSRAEALRRAQRACIDGTLQASSLAAVRGKAATTATAATSMVGGHASFPGFSHPYFWAPFILMGNWQ